MKKAALKLALVAGFALPATLHAADDDLQKKIDKLSKQVDELTGQVKKDEAKSLGKWLSIGGEYRFRFDSLHGQTVPYTDAIGTMGNLVGAFTAPNGVAGSPIGGLTSLNAAQFIMQGKSGVLFTPDQFNTILNQYMPQAMAAALPTILKSMGSGAVTLQNTALTSQQQAILNTLSAKVMPTVMGFQVSKVPGLLALLPAGTPGTTTIGQVFSGLPAAQRQLAMQALMQVFLGQNSGNLKMVPAYKPQQPTLMTNMFALDLHAKATQDVTVNVKLDMYKTFGAQTDAPTAGNFFADRVGVFDGTLSHVPSTSLLNVDRAFATWSNIGNQPVWFSVGRRPSTNGAPNNLRLNNERPGNGGVPALLVDYAFDGMSLGWAPDIEALPGAYAKVCYGRGFDSGFQTPGNSLKNTEMLGVAIVPVDTDPLRIWLQWNRAWDIFDFQTMQDTVFGNTAPSSNIGNGDWYGIGAMGNIKNVGPGNLNYFSDFGVSITHANHAVSQNAGFEGLMTGGFFAQEAPSDKTGYAVFAGIRYDLPSRTKLGFEFNHGTKNWIPYAAASDDMWTGKLGTRGNVYEPYIIQELNLNPISSYFSKVFFRLGYQYYDFEYTGSNNWVGAPVKISSIKSTDLMLLAPVKEAHDVYATFEVHF
ncbi:MAG TPA: DUF3373 domain-containing protein [Geobacteraceae bacterium]